MKKILFIAIIYLSQIFLPDFARADADAYEELKNKTVWYKVFWTGVHIADLVVEVKDGSMDVVIDSYGIVKKVSKYKSNTSGKFKLENGTYIPKSFYTKFRQRNGGKKINIAYSDDGKIISESVSPPDKRGKRPAVDNAMKAGTVDPVTSVMIAHAKIKESLQNGVKNFSFDMYDGRRLSKLEFTIGDKSHQKINDKKYDLIMIKFVRKPISGYTNKELARMKEEEPVFTIYLSDDKYLLPIKAYAEAPLGTAFLVKEKECSSINDCGYKE